MILWQDGFDHYGTSAANMDQYGHVGSFWVPSTANPRTGTHSLRCASSSAVGSINSAGAIRRSFPSPLTTVKVGYGFYVDDYPASETGNSGGNARVMACFISGSGPEGNISLVMGTDGSIACYNFFAWDQGLFFTIGTEIGRSNPGVVHTAAWNHFECLVNVDVSTGSVEVRIDEVTVLSLTNVNTDHYGRGAARQVMLSGGSSGTNFYIDDIVCSDDQGANADFLGDQQVFTDFPNADGATQQWAPSTGAVAYAVVDEAAPNDDTDYIEADFVNNIAQLKFPALPSNLTEVLSVGYFHRTKKTGPGASTIQLKILSNASEADGPNGPATTVYTGYLNNFETDPDTGAPWLRNAVRDATLELERTT